MFVEWRSVREFFYGKHLRTKVKFLFMFFIKFLPRQGWVCRERVFLHLRIRDAQTFTPRRTNSAATPDGFASANDTIPPVGDDPTGVNSPVQPVTVPSRGRRHPLGSHVRAEFLCRIGGKLQARTIFPVADDTAVGDADCRAGAQNSRRPFLERVWQPPTKREVNVARLNRAPRWRRGCPPESLEANTNQTSFSGFEPSAAQRRAGRR